ncbi:hypothetical protein D3C84_1038970 [compost metagenome]
MRQRLFEQFTFEGNGQQFHAHRHVEHELFAAMKKEQTALVHLPTLHPNRTRDGDGHGKAHLASGGHAMLHHALVDLLAEYVATPCRQLDERTLGRTSG